MWVWVYAKVRQRDSELEWLWVFFWLVHTVQVATKDANMTMIVIVFFMSSKQATW